VVSPSQKKAAVAHVIDQQLCSMRRACHYLGLPRSTYRYTPKPLTDRQQQLHQRIETLSWANPRYGYRRIRRLLTKEGWTIRRKQVQRVRRCQGLKVRPKPKTGPAPGDVDRGGQLKGPIAIMCGPGISSLIGPIMAVRLK
jgi:hypothetical protein